MKRFISLILVMVLAFGIFGCFAEDYDCVEYTWKFIEKAGGELYRTSTGEIADHDTIIIFDNWDDTKTFTIVVKNKNSNTYYLYKVSNLALFPTIAEYVVARNDTTRCFLHYSKYNEYTKKHCDVVVYVNDAGDFETTVSSGVLYTGKFETFIKYIYNSMSSAEYKQAQIEASYLYD